MRRRIILPPMILLRSLLILLVLALSPAHVAADGPPRHADTHAVMQMQDGRTDYCDSGAHQMTCQMQTPLPEGTRLAAPMAAARQVQGWAAPDRRHGRNPEQALRPPILG